MHARTNARTHVHNKCTKDYRNYDTRCDFATARTGVCLICPCHKPDYKVHPTIYPKRVPRALLLAQTTTLSLSSTVMLTSSSLSPKRRMIPLVNIRTDRVVMPYLECHHRHAKSPSNGPKRQTIQVGSDIHKPASQPASQQPTSNQPAASQRPASQTGRKARQPPPTHTHARTHLCMARTYRGEFRRAAGSCQW